MKLILSVKILLTRQFLPLETKDESAFFNYNTQLVLYECKMHGFIPISVIVPSSPSLPTPTQTYIIQHVRDHLELAPEIAQDLMTFQIHCKNHLFDKGLGEGCECVVSERIKEAILQF